MQGIAKSKIVDMRLNSTIQYQRNGHKIRCITQYITTDFTDAVVITSDPRICAGEDVVLTMTPPFRRSKIRCIGRIMRISESDGLFKFSRGYLARISINDISPIDRRKLELILGREEAFTSAEDGHKSKKPVALATSIEDGVKSLKDSLEKVENTLKQQARITQEVPVLDVRNILVVDDEVPHLNALERTLRNGYNVFSATNGKDGLAIMEEHDIDFIIADQRMPGMTGVEFLEKTLEKYPNVIRMILTAYADEGLFMDAINRVHVHRFMNKPWSPEKMKATVREAIESFQINRAHILGEQANVRSMDDSQDDSIP